ncbi:MAG: hypothetical protein ACI4MS_00745 [Candidatus Coproplasma sp.]
MTASPLKVGSQGRGGHIPDEITTPLLAVVTTSASLCAVASNGAQ